MATSVDGTVKKRTNKTVDSLYGATSRICKERSDGIAS